jgi:hypothetical protein
MPSNFPLKWSHIDQLTSLRPSKSRDNRAKLSTSPMINARRRHSSVLTHVRHRLLSRMCILAQSNARNVPFISR